MLTSWLKKNTFNIKKEKCVQSYRGPPPLTFLISLISFTRKINSPFFPLFLYLKLHLPDIPSLSPFFLFRPIIISGLIIWAFLFIFLLTIFFSYYFLFHLFVPFYMFASCFLSHFFNFYIFYQESTLTSSFSIFSEICAKK